MAAHKTNRLLICTTAAVSILLLVIGIARLSHSGKSTIPQTHLNKPVKNTASQDSAAESLDTLTSEMLATKQELKVFSQDNAVLKQQNQALLAQLQGKDNATTAALSQDISQLKSQMQTLQPASNSLDEIHINPEENNSKSQPIGTVTDLTAVNTLPITGEQKSTQTTEKLPAIPYYTIPANATSVHDRLMTALVGRIPVKGVVTDPYPFKIVFSDNTLAANGLRVPHLRQMIVSGYAEGDLNLVSVRGWVTSLTFVFEDGTISTTTSNDNNVGHFTKEDALGYLSDPYGNPFIRGKLITNAPTYLGVNIALGAAQGAADAYAQSQTTTQNTLVGTTTSSVTGSSSSYMAGQALESSSKEAQKWWHDREEQSFDSIYVASGQDIVVNFAKEIRIDYDPNGRKTAYAQTHDRSSTTHLD